MNHLKIENHQQLRTFTRSVLEGGFTSLMWAVWIYLFLPLLSAAMWGFGVQTFYAHVFKGAVLQELYELLTRLGLTVAVIFAALRAWEVYNLSLYGRHNRRKQNNALQLDSISHRYGLPVSEIKELQMQKEIVWDRSYEEMAGVRKSNHPEGLIFPSKAEPEYPCNFGVTETDRPIIAPPTRIPGSD